MSAGAAALAPAVPEEVPPSARHLGGRTAWLLALCCVAQFMVILDLSIVNVALPSIQAGLAFSSADLQWVVDAYAIVFAGFLMVGGRAADHFGQRRTLVAALGLFAFTSLAGGLAPDGDVLIVARGAQGLAGALMAAASLAVITSSFAAGPARNRAIALWGAMNGAGGAAGTLLGGLLTEGLGWRWVLLINPPIGVAAAVLAVRLVVDRRGESRRGFDLAGALSLTGGLCLLVLGIVNATSEHLTAPSALAPILAGAALLVAFVLVELHVATAPIVPLRRIGGPLAGANAVVALFSAALFPMWYVSSLYLQQVLGLSPLAAGLAFLPMALVIMLAARGAGSLVGRFGVRAVLSGGLAMMCGGMLLLARIEPSGSALGYVVLPGVLTAAGIGLAVVPSTIAATQSAGRELAGLASGLVNTARQAGGGLGLALLASLATVVTTSEIGRNRPVDVALTDGFRLAFLVGAALVALALVATLALVARPTAADPGAGGTRSRSGRARLGLPGAVAVLLAGFAGLDFGVAGGSGAPIGAYSLAGSRSFVSAPSLHPPRLTVVRSSLPPAPADIMLASFYDLTSPPMDGQSGPLIVNSRLQLVWFKQVPRDVVASNLSEQTYDGEPVLAWWQGRVTDTGATESGEDVVVDRHYRVVATLRGADGWIISMHSLVIVGHDAWVTANRDVPYDLYRYGGTERGALTDSAVQEYDLRTGRLLYTWDALDHVPLSDSYANPPRNGFPWDAYHVNSAEVLPGNRLLVSMRNTWAAYLVDASTGRVLWTLGGKHSTFRFGPGASFAWQHDVMLRRGSLVTMFDDECCQISGAGTYLAPRAPSRGLELRLDLATRRATLVRQYGPGTYSAAYMGSLDPLPGGDVLVGWGAVPHIAEYTAQGRLVFDATLPGPDLSYRATPLEHWRGEPLSPPAGAARRRGRGSVVYASWNGATEVAAWRVLAGRSAASLVAVARRARSGFETAVPLRRSYPVYEVEALDAHGRVLGTSAPFGAR
ncbi:MAG TPA: MFS transporter [Acidimicrobiales bacterium]|nr:MFS transporter [Acidimicrobiales bacterium]